MMKYSRRKVHFIGIGGIGISALVRWYLADKWAVSGSDLSSSQITQDLEKRGARIHIGAHRASWVPPSASLVIYSAAIKPDNPERKRARHLNILERSYAEALNQLAAGYKVIAVSGAHGKSTTTAMAALMLVRAGFDPTVIIGTKLREFKNTNFRKGESRWLLIEADEFHRSFLNYRPLAAITTNIDREHLEYYKSFTNIKKAFTKFFSHVEPSGFLILNAE
ncbi:MAG: UDP-N-acetylmuramate--L-alanine ligase, partial [Candidatus Sungbacteria bacterium]|nr:UDP-N-acetylmuramate--L-alanine ligase [Candidatus Sungbacteria bacterium]